MPGAPLDASDDLPKHRVCQVAVGELQGEVPGMPNEASAGLEQPLLKTREGPALNGDGQDEPTRQVAEVVGDDPELQADLVGPEAVAGEAVQWVASLPSLIHCAAVPRCCRSGRRPGWSRSGW
jgi:hypothetical protein